MAKSVPRRNVALHAAIFASGREQRDVAKAARVTPPDLSMAIHGRRPLKPDAQVRIARVLKVPRAELFPAE